MEERRVGGAQIKGGRGTDRGREHLFPYLYLHVHIHVNIRTTTSTPPTITLGDQITIAHPGSAQCPIACEHIKVTMFSYKYAICNHNGLAPVH